MPELLYNEQRTFRHVTFLPAQTRGHLYWVAAVKNAVSTLACVMRSRPSKYPHSSSNNCPLPFIFVTGTVSFFDTTGTLPNYGDRIRKTGLSNIAHIAP